MIYESVKYVTPDASEKKWGLYLTLAGKANIPANSEYPSGERPSAYYFNWEEGQELNEYQINYITEGSGIMETRYGRYQVKPGSVLLIYPGEWHRYKPSSVTGWREHYLGFSGVYARYLFQNSDILSNHPAGLNIGFHEKLLHLFSQIIDLVHDKKPGFQYIGSGLLIQLLGNLLYIVKNQGFNGKEIENKIRHAKLCLQEQYNEPIDMKILAIKCNMGYSNFRKMFKKYTGLSPLQYHNMYRMEKAKELLLTSEKSVKKIAIELGFQSEQYFTRLFKKKMGVTPTELREEKQSAEK
ncbi:MAG: helix-turn-helix domain-containing protein [Bacteroidales bacterium]